MQLYKHETRYNIHSNFSFTVRFRTQNRQNTHTNYNTAVCSISTSETRQRPQYYTVYELVHNYLGYRTQISMIHPWVALPCWSAGLPFSLASNHWATLLIGQLASVTGGLVRLLCARAHLGIRSKVQLVVARLNVPIDKRWPWVRGSVRCRAVQRVYVEEDGVASTLQVWRGGRSRCVGVANSSAGGVQAGSRAGESWAACAFKPRGLVTPSMRSALSKLHSSPETARCDGESQCGIWPNRCEPGTT